MASIYRKTKKKSLRGAVSKYKNEKLQSKKSEAWFKALVENHEDS